MGCFASAFDREEFTFAGQKHCISIENLTPVFPEGEKAAQKRKIEGNLFEIFSRSLCGEETPMNAIYARQSVDRAESISIESQVEFCAYELKGDPYQLYVDKGYSGKNMERPAFSRMMRDMERGLFRKVVVYKLDRISRSVLDFSAMIEQFQKYKVEFVSTMEKFDTSSPMGRAMLNICIVFAQLERETIQRRVADAYLSRSQKSFYMGGRVPYGFRLGPAMLDGVRTSRYEMVDEEAEIVRQIYELYAQPGYSCGDVARCLAENGVTWRGKTWGRGRVAALLKNPVYVRADLDIYQFYRKLGVQAVNSPDDFIGENGCYLYSAHQNESDAPEPGYLVLAPHEGIVSARLWLKCREKFPAATQSRPRQKVKNTWLAGKIKCALCGYALVDKHYPSDKRYLICSQRMSAGDCPGPGTIYSDEVEKLVSAEILHKLKLFTPLLSGRENVSSEKTDSESAAFLKIDGEIHDLMACLKSADDERLHCINERIRDLHRRKQELERSRSMASDLRARAPVIDPCSIPWSELSFESKREITEQLIRVIYVTERSISIEWLI